MRSHILTAPHILPGKTSFWSITNECCFGQSRFYRALKFIHAKSRLKINFHNISKDIKIKVALVSIMRIIFYLYFKKLIHFFIKIFFVLFYTSVFYNLFIHASSTQWDLICKFILYSLRIIWQSLYFFKLNCKIWDQSNEKKFANKNKLFNYFVSAVKNLDLKHFCKRQ